MTGKELKELRKSAGLTQEKFALRVGLTVSTISKYESGVNPISNQREKQIKRDCMPMCGVLD